VEVLKTIWSQIMSRFEYTLE